MLFIGLTMLGYISYQQLPVELIPNTELPFLIVSARSQVATDGPRKDEGKTTW